MNLREMGRGVAMHALRRLELRAVRRVPHPRDPVLQRILDAVEQAVRGRLSPEERAWVRRIEALRRELLRSDQTVSLPDYGPGNRAVSDRAPGFDRHLETRTVRDQCRLGSKSPFGALLLFRLVREFRPARCLEMGTSLGISAAYHSAALRLNGRGVLTTIEGAPELAELSRRHLQSLGLTETEVLQGRFADVLPGVLDGPETLDYVFIDGHHDGPATVAYFECIHPALAPAGALVVFDDVAWSSGMAQAWDTLRADPRIRVSVNLGAMGIGWIDGAGTPRAQAELPLHL